MCQRRHVRRNNARCLYTFSGDMGRCPPPDHYDGHDPDDHHHDPDNYDDDDDLTSCLNNSCIGASRTRLLGSSTPFTA